MKLQAAKEQVLGLIEGGLTPNHLDKLDPTPTSRDPGKFHLDGYIARVVQPFNGFYANINLDWFDGSTEPPEIQGEPFDWYIFALDLDKPQQVSHYYAAPYETICEFVLDFDAPLGEDHQDHHDWRGRIDKLDAKTGLFVWGDEEPEDLGPERRIPLNNLPEALENGAQPGDQGSESPPSSQPSAYKDFGPAPPDDPDELQEFARRVRRGQPKFRETLLNRYEDRCAVTGQGPPEVLEAAHMESHADTGHNHPDNGLLLRADIHYLFDEGLLTIDPETYVVNIDEALKETPYWRYHGAKLRRRTDGGYPDGEALEARQGEAGSEASR